MIVALRLAAQLAIVAHAPDSVLACDAVDLSVAVSAPGNLLPRLIVPSLAPFDVLRASPHIEHVRGSTILEYRFTIATGRVGRVVVPPFEAILGETRASSGALSIDVAQPRGRLAPEVIARARIDTNADVNLRGVGAADTVFVGQQATYEVAVFLNQSARERLRRNPTFYPPEMQAMLAYDLPAPDAPARRAASQCFDALVYRRALFPLVAGRLVIPPAQLVYSTGYSLLSREESHELQTDSVSIVAIEPPPASRPAEFVGAVGAISLDARLDPATSRVGDPMLFTVRVRGRGNVKLFPRPQVELPWAALVPADERVRIDSTTQRVAGIKEFDWVLTPRIAGEFDVPPVRYGYFDPASRRYDVAETPGTRVLVAPGALSNADTGHVESALGIRVRYGGSSWPPPQSHPAFWVVLALVPIPALAARARRRARRSTPVRPVDPAELLAALPADDAIGIRRQFVRTLAARLGCSPEDFTHPGALERALRRAGVSDETSTRAELMLRALDSASYDRIGALPRNAPREAGTIARAVDAEALSRRELPFWLPMTVIAFSVTATSLLAANLAASHFARGVSAYVRQDYATARTAFADAASAAPSSPDAWANYGTASWSMSDTAAAVYGWRQSLALQPDAQDMQVRSTLAHDMGMTAPGWVPALPSHAGVWTFAILWMAAWTFAWIARRPHPWAARAVVPVIVCALLIGVFAIELETRVAGNRLGVVRRGVALSSDPAIGVDRGPAVAAGEIVRIAGRRGTWTRIEATDERDGWIPSTELLRIADRRPPRD
ncbi:MAG TPA: hypothetical protein VKH19_06945 [Gemmatimonadaceae bacterium]|nr:hypothetical protein [Gemmatimonadaceae bacterium]